MIVEKKVGIFIFDEVEILDFAGPYEVFSSTRLNKKLIADIHKTKSPFKVFTFSEKKKKITTSGGLCVNSEYTFKTCPKLDIMIIPGGIGTRKLLKNQNVINWIMINKKINILASVCTGALLLAQAGLLIEKKATTHWGAFDLLKKISPTTKPIINKKFIFDTYYTSSGVSAGIDLSLFIIKKLYGKTIAQNTAKYMEYKF